MMLRYKSYLFLKPYAAYYDMAARDASARVRAPNTSYVSISVNVDSATVVARGASSATDAGRSRLACAVESGE